MLFYTQTEVAPIATRGLGCCACFVVHEHGAAFGGRFTPVLKFKNAQKSLLSILYEAVRHTQLVGLQRAVWYSRPVWAKPGSVATVVNEKELTKKDDVPY